MQPELIADCVHCGFCLPACPTYSLWHEEMDSPRGRIHLMSALVDGTMRVDRHRRRALRPLPRLHGVRARLPVGRAVRPADRVDARPHRGAPPRGARRAAAARVDLRRVPAPAPAARRARVSTAACARPASRRSPPSRRRGSARAGRPSTSRARARASRWLPAACRASSSATSTRRPRACSRRTGTTCTFRARRAAAARCTPTPGGSTRASPARARSSERSQRLRRDRHERGRLRLASQGSRHRERRRRLGAARRSARASGAQAARAARRVSGLVPPEARAAHRGRAARGAAARSPASSVLEPGEQELCCGSAGIYNLVQPRRRASSATARPTRVLATEPEAYASGNPGCLVQVTAALRRAGRPLPAFHPIELVDASIRGVERRAVLAARAASRERRPGLLAGDVDQAVAALAQRRADHDL